MAERIQLDPDDATPMDVYMQLVRQNASMYPKGDCIPCGATIRVGFFFDAFGRHRDIDDKQSSQYSNICRLFDAHRRNLDQRRPVNQFWFPFYYSGLGTPLNEDAESHDFRNAVIAAAKLGGKKAVSTATSVAQAVTRVDTPITQTDVKGKVKAAARESVATWSTRPMIQAFQDIRKDIENIPRTARRIGNVLNRSPEAIWKRTKAGGVALWRNVKHDLRTPSPMKVAQGVARALFLGVVEENVPIIRDNALMAREFGTGVDSRLIAAKRQFKGAFDAVKTQMPKVRIVEVSVFGADRGGVLARAFVNDLVREYKRRDDTDLAIEGVEIKIKFLGLLDAVSSTMSEETGELIGLIPLLGTIKPSYRDRNLAVPACVQRCVHFAAAHEMRFYQRLDSLEKSRGEQFLYPGTSCDVVGGVPNGSMGFNAELMRVPLRDMLMEALKAGAAVDTMEDLYSYNAPTFKKFTIAQPINCDGKQYRIKSLVDAYREIVPRTQGVNFVAHSKVFLRWITVRYQDPAFRASVGSWRQQLNDADVQRRTTKTALDMEMQRLGVTMSMLSNVAPEDQARLRQLKADHDTAQQQYESLVGNAPANDFSTVWERLDSEAKDIISRWSEMEPEYEADRRRQALASFNNQEMTYTPLVFAPAHARRVELTPDQIELAKAWQQGSSGHSPLPDLVMKLFDMLVHDTLLTSWQDHVLAPSLYFRTRDKDVFGVTGYAQEQKQRDRDDASATRIDQLQKANQQQISGSSLLH